MLGKMESGAEYEQVLQEAQELGYAEVRNYEIVALL